MRVLMLGWEFPPFISGGLGTACYGLTQGLSQLGTEITFVLPRPIASSLAEKMSLLGLGNPGGKLKNVRFRTADVKLYPYANPGRLVPVGAVKSNPKKQSHASMANPGSHYAGDMFTQIQKYTDFVCDVAAEEPFDLIHAHDWMTFPAAIAAADLTGKPLVVHIHSTEKDRSGQNVNQSIYDIERHGMHRADRVIAVSRYTQRICTEEYSVDKGKVHIVYNAIDPLWLHQNHTKDDTGQKIVLFLGRITMQKGPEYFLFAAKRVLEVLDNVKFVMAGDGDMFYRMIDLAAHLGIGSKVLFTGFLQGNEVTKIYQMADLYVMPSVSEPFGIAPLEAISNNVPVMISKQSGVSEVLRHVLKVDFWDIDEMANKIIAVLKYSPLKKTLSQNGAFEVRKFNWTDSAKQCIDVYNSVAGRAG